VTDVDDNNDCDPATNAVDLFELRLEDFYEHEIHDPKTHASIPRDVARAVLDLAKKGQHKGRGRGGVPRSELATWCQDLIVEEAKEHRAGLLATGMSPADATDAATAKAAQRLHDDYGMNLAPDTIKRRMESNKRHVE
jgi:hypothetical protein